MVPLVRIEPGTNTLLSQLTWYLLLRQTLGSLYGHALFILTESSNHQVVHEQKLICMHTFHIYSILILVTDVLPVLHSLVFLYKLQSKRLLTISVSLCTHAGICHLTIQVLNTKSLFPKYLIYFSDFCTL